MSGSGLVLILVPIGQEMARVFGTQVKISPCIVTKLRFLFIQISTNVQSLHHFQTEEMKPIFKVVTRRPAVKTM